MSVFGWSVVVESIQSMRSDHLSENMFDALVSLTFSAAKVKFQKQIDWSTSLNISRKLFFIHRKHFLYIGSVVPMYNFGTE